MELSVASFKRYKNNCIVLEDLIIIDGKVFYNTTSFGCNINEDRMEIKLNETKWNYVMSVVDKTDIIDHKAFKM